MASVTESLKLEKSLRSSSQGSGANIPGGITGVWMRCLGTWFDGGDSKGLSQNASLILFLT